MSFGCMWSCVQNVCNASGINRTRILRDPKALKDIAFTFFFVKDSTSKLHTCWLNFDPTSAPNLIKNVPKLTPQRPQIEPKSASWGGPGRKSDLGGLLGGSWGDPEGSFGRPCGSLGARWGVFGRSWGRFGRSLGPPGGVLGPPGALLGCLGGHPGVNLEVL